MLWKLQVLTLSVESGISYPLKNLKPRNIFLDLWSQGQQKRRYFLGRFSHSKHKQYVSVVHFTFAPVTLQLSYGVGGVTLLYNNLGRHTLFEFLEQPFPQHHESHNFAKRQFLPFGRGGPVYQLEYILTPVNCTYGFAINEISCLSQVSSKLRKDPLFVEVEFSHSSHSVLPGPTNRYQLGNFSSNEVSTIHSVNNCTFSSVSNFVITFFVRGWMSDHILGTLKFVPFHEALLNESPLVYDYINTNGVSKLDELIGTTKETDVNERKEIDQNRKGLNSGLLFSFVENTEAPEEVEEELVLLEADTTCITKTLTLSSPEGGSYIIVFTLTKEYEGMKGDHVVPSPLWNFVGKRDHYLLYENGTLHDTAIQPHGSERNTQESAETKRKGSRFLQAEKKLEADKLEDKMMITSENFSKWTQGNNVDVLIDGLETFERMYECMMLAQHSISILAWEISLSFGLVYAQRSKLPLPVLTPPSAKWVSLEDVLLSRALAGVVVRIIVWRHEWLSHLNRFLYLGEWSIDREVAKLQNRCQKHGLVCKVFKISNIPDGSSPYANPYDNATGANVMVIIAGNPKGVYSAHHEKLVLIDSQCPEHAVAFTGGFDIARGRYDQPLHQLPRPYWEDLNPISGPSHEYGHEVQPLLKRIRILWHDIQLMIQGPAAQHLQLHFAQRWSHSFTHDPCKTQNFTHSIPQKRCTMHRMKPSFPTRYSDCQVRLTRVWNGVFEGHFLFDDYCKMVAGARRFLYLEHQYPFQNFALTYYMCQALRANPQLLLLIVTPVQTDLPRGIVGEWIDWSQDQIIEHLHMIYRVAPERVGIYGLVRQDDRTDRIKPIYVHSKLMIADDECMLTGTSNMDNMSFFYSSELGIMVPHPQLARETRNRLIREHLGPFYKQSMAHRDNFQQVFDAFHEVAVRNSASLRASGTLVGRPVSMAPDSYRGLLNRVYYPNKLSKFLIKTVGLDTEDMWLKMRSRLLGPPQPKKANNSKPQAIASL